jgi:hypothetical protein
VQDAKSEKQQPSTKAANGKFGCSQMSRRELLAYCDADTPAAVYTVVINEQVLELPHPSTTFWAWYQALRIDRSLAEAELVLERQEWDVEQWADFPWVVLSTGFRLWTHFHAVVLARYSPHWRAYAQPGVEASRDSPALLWRFVSLVQGLAYVARVYNFSEPPELAAACIVMAHEKLFAMLSDLSRPRFGSW